MTVIQAVLHRPQSLWLRRALFQVHLWTGIGAGLYILLMSLTGSALVFHRELEAVAAPPAELSLPAGAGRLSLEELKSRAEASHPGFVASWFHLDGAPERGIEVWIETETSTSIRRFHPVSGADLGPAHTGFRGFLHWLSQLHFYLLSGSTGLLVNGAGGCLLAVLCLTGVVVWWPGRKNWRRATTVRWGARWKRVNWDLHSALGFWAAAFVLMWAVTGAYFAFPAPFRSAVGAVASLAQVTPPAPPDFVPGRPFAPVDRIVASAEQATQGMVTVWVGMPHHPGETVASVYRQESYDAATDGVRIRLDAYTGRVLRVERPELRSTGDAILRWLAHLHFGDFGGLPVKALWSVLGLVPGALFLTGFLMWWNRVAVKRLRTRGSFAAGRGGSLPVRHGAAAHAERAYEMSPN